MKRILLASALTGALALGACSSGAVASNTAAVISDAQALLTTLQAKGAIPASTAALVSKVITSLEAIDSAAEASLTSGADAEATVITVATTAVTQLAANTTDATVKADAATAEALLAALPANTAETAQSQIESALGTLLIDYLASVAPAAATPGAAPTQIEQLIIDARKHIAALG